MCLQELKLEKCWGISYKAVIRCRAMYKKSCFTAELLAACALISFVLFGYFHDWALWLYFIILAVCELPCVFVDLYFSRKYGDMFMLACLVHKKLKQVQYALDKEDVDDIMQRCSDMGLYGSSQAEYLADRLSTNYSKEGDMLGYIAKRGSKRYLIYESADSLWNELSERGSKCS